MRVVIEKWYQDVVTADGDAFIGYAALIRFDSLSLRYSGQLNCTNGNVTSASTLRNFEKPKLLADTLRWHNHPLDIRGRWRRRIDRVESTLLDRDDGVVRWQCTMPMADVTLQLGENTFQGLGYAEKLTMTLPPWDLPIDELRWGRFLSPDASLVWIKWCGAHPLRLIYLDGKPVDDCDLDLWDRIPLRQGSLAKTVFLSIPTLARILPQRILGTEEHKWLSRGRLRDGDRVHDGWAIHEVVKWA